MSALEQVEETSELAALIFTAAEEELLAKLLESSVKQAHCVIGAAGAGKTTLLRELVRRIVADNRQSKILVLHSSRQVAGALRNQISLDIGGLSIGQNVKTFAAQAFAILSAYNQEQGRGIPSLITGPELEAMLAQLLALPASSGVDVSWLVNAEVSEEEIRKSPAIRAEFREILTRSAELGLSPQGLQELGEKFQIPAWRAAAKLAEVYEQGLATRNALNNEASQIVDYARVVSDASNILRAIGEQEDKGIGLGALASVAQFDWVLVDDLQNAPLSALALLRELQGLGARIVAFADPDLAVEGFRGGIAKLPALLERKLAYGGLAASRHILQENFRLPEAVAQLATQVAGTIHTSFSATHRNYRLVNTQLEKGKVDFCSFASNANRIKYIANYLQELHLVQKVPYAQMAIITRNTSEHSLLRYELAQRKVPVAGKPAALPLRDYQVVQEIVAFISAALQPSTITPVAIRQLLVGKLFDLTSSELALQVSRLWAQLKLYKEENPQYEQVELVAEDELLQFIFTRPDLIALAPDSALADIAKIVQAVQEDQRKKVGALDILWNFWERLDLARNWQEIALSNTAFSVSANEDLDAMINLFAVAKRLQDNAEQRLDFFDFVEYIFQQDIAQDTVAITGVSGDKVTLITPNGGVGKTWQYVVIWDLNQGKWPNLKLRNPLVRSTLLQNISVQKALGVHVADGQDLISEVLDDELRMLLLALTRATREVTLTCIDNTIDTPSSILQYLLESTAHTMRVPSVQDTAYGDAQLVGILRKLAKADQANLTQIKELIGQLYPQLVTENGLDFIDEYPVSSTAPIQDGEVRISPSRLSDMQKCSLKGFFNLVGAQADGGKALLKGNLLHEFAEKYPQGAGDVAVIKDFIASKTELIEQEVSPIEQEKFYSQLWHCIENYETYAQNFTGKVLVELPVQYKQEGNFLINARLDRVEINADSPPSVQAVDLKTSNMRVEKDDLVKHAQLLAYQFLIMQGALEHPDLPENIQNAGAKLVNVQINQRPQVLTQAPITVTELQDFSQSLCQVADSLRQAEFAANKTNECDKCAYQNLCPAMSGKQVYSK